MEKDAKKRSFCLYTSVGEMFATGSGLLSAADQQRSLVLEDESLRIVAKWRKHRGYQGERGIDAERYADAVYG